VGVHALKDKINFTPSGATRTVHAGSVSFFPLSFSVLVDPWIVVTSSCAVVNC